MTVTPFDRLSFQVVSRTDPEDTYVVDLEEMTCTCDAFMFPNGSPLPCAHLDYVSAMTAKRESVPFKPHFIPQQ